MIDPDLRQIIELELQDGEELLWAEKTTSHWQGSETEHVDHTQRLIKILAVTIPVIAALMLYFPPFRIVGILLIMLLPAVLISNIDPHIEVNPQFSDKDIGGYALSNLRLFEFDRRLTISMRLPASDLKKVREIDHWIKLSPIGKGPLNFHNLYFLTSNYATAAYINRLLSENVLTDASGR